MKQISTSALAKERNLETKDLFSTLKEKGWIYKKDEQWHLTKEGRMAGGDMKYNPQYGEYIVWPANLDIQKALNKVETLSSTELGKKLDLTAQKVNLILQELGWIAKSDVGGWKLTSAGEKQGGYKMEATNGAPYVIWSSSLLTNKNFLYSVKKTKGDYVSVTPEEEKTGELDDYRLRYPANFRTQDGHRVRSISEALIDDYLYKAGIVHAYERKLPIEEEVLSDFYILKGNVYIEFWGIENDPKYAERKKRKLEIYAKEKLNLIELTKADIQSIDDTLPRKLRQYGINVE